MTPAIQPTRVAMPKWGTRYNVYSDGAHARHVLLINDNASDNRVVWRADGRREPGRRIRTVLVLAGFSAVRPFGRVEG